MTEPLALRTHLDRLRCDEPGCECDDELVLGPVCHDGAPVWAEYHKGGELELVCSVCGEPIVRVAVAG
jgi:hypothetical protein